VSELTLLCDVKVFCRECGMCIHRAAQAVIDILKDLGVEQEG